MIASEVALKTTESSTPHFRGSATKLVLGAAKTDTEREAMVRKTEVKCIVGDELPGEARGCWAFNERMWLIVERQSRGREAFCRAGQGSAMRLPLYQLRTRCRMKHEICELLRDGQHELGRR
jgi:hypothetical protein